MTFDGQFMAISNNCLVHVQCQSDYHLNYHRHEKIFVDFGASIAKASAVCQKRDEIEMFNSLFPRVPISMM